MQIKSIAITLALGLSTIVTPVVAEEDEYMSSVLCGMNAMMETYSDDANTIISYCVGNSHDPEGLELQAYLDVATVPTYTSKYVPDTCKMDYAVWYGNGSRAHDWIEGAVFLTTEEDVLSYLSGGLEVAMVQNSRVLGAAFMNKAFTLDVDGNFNTTAWGKGCFTNLREIKDNYYLVKWETMQAR